jgi:hypothetical protein
MEEKFIQLVEKYFDKTITKDEEKELDELLSADKDFKKEFEDQKRMKEVFSTMKLKSPGKELWDGYWENTYNRLERGLGWLALFIGSLILIGYASIEIVEKFYTDNSSPLIIKIGVVAAVFGLLVLLFSVLREKLFTFKNDKYKEVKR